MDVPETAFTTAALVLLTSLVVAQSGLGEFESLFQLIEALIDLFVLLSELLGSGLLAVVVEGVAGVS